jgi:hypothetical protein
MRRKLFVWFAVVLMLAATASTALAARPHFKTLSISSTTTTTTTSSSLASITSLSSQSSFTSEALIAQGSIAGLGSSNVVVKLEGTGVGTATCTNPGGTQAPGQNPISVTVSGSTSVLVTDNGSAEFYLQTAAAAQPSTKQAGCPNGRWSVTGLAVDWTRAVVTVTDANTGKVLLTAIVEDPA